MDERLHPGRIAAILGFGWLAYPVSDLLASDAGALRVAWVLALVGVFVLSTLGVLLGNPADAPPPTTLQVWRFVALLAAIDTALALGDRGEWATVLTVYVVAFAAVPTAGLRGFAVVAAGVAFGYVLMRGGGIGQDAAVSQTLTLAGLGTTLLAVGHVVRANRQLALAREELATLAVEDERRRFARDVHDLLGHSLSVIALKAQVAGRMVELDPARAQAEIAEVEAVSRRALTEVRAAVTATARPTIGGELAAARRALESAGLALEAHVTRLELDAVDEEVLAWALREATTNVVRHADARRVRLSVEARGDHACLEIADDGTGPGAIATDGPGGHGLRGLAERVAERSGELVAGPAPEGGFRLAVTLPGAVRG